MARLTDEQKEKYRSINQRSVGGPGTFKKVIKDERGSHEVHHWDGRQDAHVMAPAVELTVTTKEGT